VAMSQTLFYCSDDTTTLSKVTFKKNTLNSRLSGHSKHQEHLANYFLSFTIFIVLMSAAFLLSVNIFAIGFFILLYLFVTSGDCHQTV